ncbi:type II secretion system F family protein [Pseudonocardia sichuanensis]|uniref:Type II secretion system (T2SS) protein F n=1 Tax=Pseudonocardia kunmingensis TaxID=630975 RepID=A0A543D9N3_9PSEU|nr:type II secretion system F family protein [Pseudonocardia kunmingensis]TQM06016.1 type II secretion system (T2SS) protein F [Pseudonocardia kunmingensis]
MIVALALGCGWGIGLWALAVYGFPPRVSLGEALARAIPTPSIPPPTPPPLLDGVDAGWVDRVGRPFVGPMRSLGLPGTRLGRDLAVLGRATSGHLAQKAVLSLAGLLLPAIAQLVLALVGAAPGIELPVLAALVLAAAGFVAPDLGVRRDAAALRTGFRHALSGYLDLVWITLAGGAGVDSALGDCVAIGRGWAFDQIRRALDTARLTRVTPWATLRRLGEELDVTELAELAGTVSLAGTEGAKVRVSLGARAAAMRTRQITEAEGAAEAATERMSLPVMVLFLGFLTLIAFPALVQVLEGL